MRTIEEIRADLNACDAQIASLITRRMECIEEIIEYKRVNSVPIFQPKQEERQKQMLERAYANSPFIEENEEVFRTITRMSKKVQAKALVDYNIALIGFMGAGKSTVSNFLHEMLALDLIEMDAMIEKEQGMTISEIFDKYGESYFRNCESNMVIELQNVERTVISCGGGLVMREENVENLKKSSRIVLLSASPESIFERVKSSSERPLLNGHMELDYIADLMEKRRPKYEAAADFIVNTDNRSVVEICEEIIRVIHK